MITSELRKLIKQQKKQNVSDEIIKETLLKKGYLKEDISQILIRTYLDKQPRLKIPSEKEGSLLQFPKLPQLPPIPSLPKVTLSKPAKQINIEAFNTEQKSKIFLIFSIIFFVLSLAHAVFAVYAMVILFSFQWTSLSGGSPAINILKIYPVFGIIPLLSLFGMLALLYTGLKIIEGSKSSWRLGILSLLVFVLPSPYIVSRIFMDFLFLPIGFSGNHFLSMGSNLLPLITNCDIFIPFIIILLLIFIRKFKYGPGFLSKKSKTFFAQVIILFAFPISLFLGYSYLTAINLNYVQSKIQPLIDSMSENLKHLIEGD